MLPSDFDIFSAPRLTKPLCSQNRANGFPVAASDWAISHEWCGKTRSSPPPCRSSVSPRYFIAIAEHSMCQPGRPGPQGLGQDGSPGFAAFQSAKSRGSRFRSLTSTRAPASNSSRFLPDRRPYVGNRTTSKYTSPSTT